MGKSIEQVIEDFVDQKTNKEGEVEGHNNRNYSIYYEGQVLYSYGPHFPLAIMDFDPDTGKPTRAMINNRKYSQATSRHQADTRRILDERLPTGSIMYTDLRLPKDRV